MKSVGRAQVIFFYLGKRCHPFIITNRFMHSLLSVCLVSGLNPFSLSSYNLGNIAET